MYPLQSCIQMQICKAGFRGFRPPWHLGEEFRKALPLHEIDNHTYHEAEGLAGNVLVPVDTAGRALELVLLLERAWADARLTYPLLLLTPVAYTTLEFAKSQLEWMNSDMARAFEQSRDNPFACR